ncbi:MAG: hypothetical protein JO125_06705 [Chloroflexi bacterium]|nr:hypothetical protein [Chloroflexota bacterium]
MRQGSGAELLGANHPLSASIGIIYVSPDDDRKSVLAAILTQEKLGRTQVAVVLPNQNKAFQRPGDFDDLRSMFSKLQAQIIFIIPSGPGPSEFARQRRFTVYPSLEDYAEVLQEEEEQRIPNGQAAGGAALASHQQDAEGDMDDADALPPIPTPVPSPEPTQVNGGKFPNGKKEGPAPIDLSVSRPKITTNLPTAEPVQNTTPTKNTAKRSSGKITAIGPIAATSTGANVASRPITNVPTPARRQNRTGTGRGGRRSGRNVLIAVALVLLVLLLALCSVAYAAPGALGPLRGLASLLPHFPSGTTVTITPANPLVSNSYVIEAVTGTPNAAQHQVSARLLSQPTPSQQKTVSATGTGHTDPIQATGTLTFKNGMFVEQTVAAGTVFTGADGVQVANDVAANIPAANANNNTLGIATVSAHAVVGGTAGNIGAGDISGTCCGSGSIFVTNSAFSGGKDPVRFTAVAQSDIDNAAKPLADSLITQAQQGLNAQVRSGEKLLASPQCPSNVTADHHAGDRADNVTVTVSAKCDGEVYDQKGTESLIQTLLQQRADSSLGPGYVLVGNIDIQTTVPSSPHGNVSLLVKAQGKYQMSAALQQQLKKQIAGKSVTEARTLLKSQKGIADVTIQANGNTLPTDPSQISIVVQNVTGSLGAANDTPTMALGGTLTAQLGLGGG